MARVVIDTKFESYDLELLFLFHLCFHERKYDLLLKTYPNLFAVEDLKKAFEILVELGPTKQDMISMSVEMAKRYGVKTTAPWDKFLDPAYQYSAEHTDPWGIHAELRDLLFKRLATERLQRMANLVEHGKPSDAEKDGSLFTETTELLLLQDRLLGERKYSSEDVARMVAERINTTGDLVVTGFKFLNDRIAGLTRRTISSILALPGHYKSSFLDALAYETLMVSNEKILIVSLEDPVEERIKRIVANRMDLSLSDMRFKKIQVPQKDILQMLKIDFGDRLYVYDPRDIVTPEQAAIAIGDVKPALCVIDHIQNFQMQDMVEGLIRASWHIETAAIRHNCHCIVASQVADKRVMSREDTRIHAGDAQWTSALRQKSAEMFSLMYQYQLTANIFQKNTLQMSILKSRFAGAVGNMVLQIDPDKGRVLGLSSFTPGENLDPTIFNK
jgi:replicative DNA helicase